MRREYEYKITTIRSRIVVLKRYHGREIGEEGREIRGCGGAFGVAAGEYLIPTSMHAS
jgi:hypothetical protein